MSTERWTASQIYERTQGGQRFDVTHDVQTLAEDRDYLEHTLVSLAAGGYGEEAAKFAQEALDWPERPGRPR